jgi:hypothetical protein
MTIIPFTGSTPVPSDDGAIYPGPDADERVERRAKGVVEAWYALHHAETYGSDRRAAVAAAEAVIAAADSTRRELNRAMAPATHDDIAYQLAALVAAFPNSRADELYGRILVADVGALQPSVGAIGAACRELRRSSKFLPAIAEVCAALADAERTFRLALERIDELPPRIAEAKKRLQEDAEWRQREREERRRRMLSGPESK